MRSDDETRAALAAGAQARRDGYAQGIAAGNALADAMRVERDEARADRERYRGMLAHIEAENAQLLAENKAVHAEACSSLLAQGEAARAIEAERDEARAALAAVRDAMAHWDAPVRLRAILTDAGVLAAAGVPEPPTPTLQRRLFDECETAGWDPDKRNTFAEEIAHLHEEVSEAFRAWRLRKDAAEIWTDADGKPQGVPVEFADVLIGMFYNAELHGFDLLAAVEAKHRYNLTRRYPSEGRQLHPAAESPVGVPEPPQERELEFVIEARDGRAAAELAALRRQLLPDGERITDSNGLEHGTDSEDPA